MEPLSTLGAIFFFVLVPCAAVLSYTSRKIGADLQARVGPNRAGPRGFLQPFADLLKDLQKEEAAATASLFQQTALALAVALILSTVVILPLSSALLLLDADMSVFFALWAALGVGLIMLFVGFHQGTVPAWISAIRVAFQAVSGTFPGLLAILCVGVEAGGFRWENILAAQGPGPFSWMIFSSPFEPLAFLVFVVSGLILFSIPPMDTGLSRTEIEGGLSSLWGGRNLSLFKFMRFYGFFLWSCMATALFLGGWLLPGSTDGIKDSLGPEALTIIETAVLLLKAVFLMLVIGAITRANPRTRADQVTGLAWRVLSPIGLVALIGSALWRVFA